MTVRVQACRECEADIRVLTNSASEFGKIGGVPVDVWNGAVLSKNLKAIDHYPRNAALLMLVALISGVAAAVFFSFSIYMTASVVCGGVAVFCLLATVIAYRKKNRLLTELKKQYALNAQAYLAKGPVGAFERKCTLETFKNAYDLEVMDLSYEMMLKVDDAFQKANRVCTGAFQQKFVDSLQSQQLRFESRRDMNPKSRQDLEDIVVKWFQGEHAVPEVTKYCEMQGYGWAAPNIQG